MKIVIPQEIFEEFNEIAEAKKSPIQKYLQKGSKFSVEDYEKSSDAKNLSPDVKDLFAAFGREVDIFEGAKVAIFAKRCILAFNGSVDDELLTYIFNFLVILLSLNHFLEVPDFLNICKNVLAFNLDKYAESHVVSYFKYLTHYVVAKLIICPEFNYCKSSADVKAGLDYAKLAHTVAISTQMSAPKLGAVYFLMAAYHHRLSDQHSLISEERDTNLDSAGIYVGRGLSNLGMPPVDKWKEFKDLQNQLSRSAMQDQLLTNDTHEQSLTSNKNNPLLASPNLKLALAHPDAFMLLTHMLNNNHVAILSHEKLNANMLRQLCDKRFHWLFMQKFTSDEIVECCANANYFSLLKELSVKNYIISNNLSLRELQRIPVEEIKRRSNANSSDISCSPSRLVPC